MSSSCSSVTLGLVINTRRMMNHITTRCSIANHDSIDAALIGEPRRLASSPAASIHEPGSSRSRKGAVPTTRTGAAAHGNVDEKIVEEEASL